MTSHRYRLAILDDYQGAALVVADWDGLKSDADIEVFREPLGNADQVAAALEPFEIICVLRERTPLPADLLARLPRLRLIASTGRRNASIDIEAAVRLGIAVTHTDAMGSGAIEMTWALILAAMRHVPEEVASVRAGGWQTTVGADLRGRQVGLVGVGSIGAAVARVGLAFGMDVASWSPNLTPERAAEIGVRWLPKSELFESSDIISLHLVLSDRTRAVVGQEELALMKSDAWLINSARGGLVDTTALIACLKEQRIAGAAIDVFDQEPLAADDEMRRLPNLLPTPHIGFVTRRTYEAFYGGAVRAIRAWIDEDRTRPARNCSDSST